MSGKRISLDLGGGGRLMRQFIAEKIVPAFRDPALLRKLDAVAGRVLGAAS